MTSIAGRLVVFFSTRDGTFDVFRAMGIMMIAFEGGLGIEEWIKEHYVSWIAMMFMGVGVFYVIGLRPLTRHLVALARQEPGPSLK